jgi:hypothetical protein
MMTARTYRVDNFGNQRLQSNVEVTMVRKAWSQPLYRRSVTIAIALSTVALGGGISGCSTRHMTASAPPCEQTEHAASAPSEQPMLTAAAASLPVELIVLPQADSYPHCVSAGRDRTIVLGLGDYLEFQDRAGDATSTDPYLSPPTSQPSGQFSVPSSSQPFNRNILRVTTRSAPTVTFGPAVCAQEVVRLTAVHPGTGIIYFPSDCCGTEC